jgi:hypothetical protein
MFSNLKSDWGFEKNRDCVIWMFALPSQSMTSYKRVLIALYTRQFNNYMGKYLIGH